MSKYTIEEKDSFTVLGIGIELKSDYTDFEGLNKEKSDFWQSISSDGRLSQLKSIASNDYVFTVNEAVNNRMMHYAGVISDVQLPETTRLIQFPKGEYLVVKGDGKTSIELSNKLTAITFGQVLREEEHIAYVGGPNTTVELGQSDGLILGEMWVPIVRR